MKHSIESILERAEYDTLVLPTLAMIEPFRGGGLERWYIQQVTRRTFLAVTGVGFMSRSSTSAGPVYRQRLAPRPMLPPRSRPPRLLVDEFGHPVPPPPRRVSRLCILRRVRLVLLAVRAGRAAHFATALAQHEQTKRRAADPRAAHAGRLKQCAKYLLGESAGLNIIAEGTIPDIAGWADKLPTGQRYFCPWGWPIDRASRLTAEIDLFYKLLAESGPDTPAAPATTEPLDTPAAPVSEWNGLLCQPEKFGLTQLLDAFRKVGLLSDNGEPTEWGRTCKGAWAGALDALTTPPALLTVNALAAGRCLAGWGIVVSPNTLRNNTSAEADNTRKVMNRALAGLRR